MSNMIKCFCRVVDIMSQKRGTAPRASSTRTKYSLLSEGPTKIISERKEIHVKGPSDDFLQIFTEIKYSAKLKEPNIPLYLKY